LLNDQIFVLSIRVFKINDKVLKERYKVYLKIYISVHEIDHPIMFEEGAYLKTGFNLFSK
jgi:hypothetical protein